jgi:uncharacterized membrane protein
MDRTRVDNAVVAALDRGAAWCVDHWLAAFNTMMAVYVVLPLLAPPLLAVGSTGAADLIYWAYSYTCHQLPSHSWFVFGHQMAYCQRDTAIYTAMLVGGIAYGRARLWTRGLPLWAYVLLSLPIAIDGGTALFGLRESTPLLRTLTGALFGLASAWFVYPLTDRALAPFAGLPARASEVS